MNIQLLDFISWGQPSREDRNNMQNKNYLFDVLPDLQKWSPPQNSSKATLEELNQLVAYSKMTEGGERRRVFDSDLVPYINDLFAKNGVDPDIVKDLTKTIVLDVIPLITFLKYHFQRPRPAQLAYYYELDFFPCFSKFVSSPSYPSGHSTMCLVIAEVLGTKYARDFPGCFEIMSQFAEEVAESRLYMGVHYASDNRFARQTALAIINNREFRKKYGF